MCPTFRWGRTSGWNFWATRCWASWSRVWLYLRHPDKQEGELTALRGARLRPDPPERLGRPDRPGRLKVCSLSRGEEYPGRSPRASITGRAFEALLGALYIDGGLRVVERVLKRFLAATSENDIAEALRADYKSLLQRQVQSIFKTPPVYRLAGTSGPAHQRLFHMEVWSGERLLGTGEGRNKQQAEQAAAQAPPWGGKPNGTGAGTRRPRGGRRRHPRIAPGAAVDG